MADIHPTAVIAPGAELGVEVAIGPYCVVGEGVRLGDRCHLDAHVVISGHTTLGADCRCYPFSCIGGQTQDLKYRGGTTRVEIGARTTFREYVTVNAATDDGNVTRVGDDCHILAYAHIAHDCAVGNGVIMANCGTLAGHVIVEDHAILGGLSAVHQFVRLGRMSITGGCSRVAQDVPPFMTAAGNPLKIHSINAIGLQRKGVPREVQRVLKKTYRILYRQGLTTSQAVAKLETELPPLAEVGYLIAFIKASQRGITK